MKIGAEQLRRLVKEAMEEMEGEEQFRPKPGSREEAGERLLEIGDEIRNLLKEAWGLVSQWGDETEIAAARAYWYGHMLISLGRGHGYMARGSHTLEDTAEELMYGDEDDTSYGESERVPGGHMVGDED